jgi:hypothetical protein
VTTGSPRAAEDFGLEAHRERALRQEADESPHLLAGRRHAKVYAVGAVEDASSPRNPEHVS